MCGGGGIGDLVSSVTDAVSNAIGTNSSTSGINTALNDPSKIFTDPTSTGIVGLGIDPVAYVSGGTPSYQNPIMQAIGAYALGDYAFGGTGAAATGTVNGVAADGTAAEGTNLFAGQTAADAASQTAGYSSVGAPVATGGATTSTGIGSLLTANQLGMASLASGVLGIANAGNTANKAASAADPFASQRPQYAAQLSALMADPNNVMPTMPGYQAGLQATERADAAQGFAGGGRSATDIANYSGNFYNSQVATLAGLAGANAGNTGAAASAINSGGTSQMSALNTLAAGASLLWGNK